MYEKYLVEHGFKWSPVKVFRRRMSRTSGDRWQIQMRLLYRDEAEEEGPQHAALVVTLSDPNKTRPVYNDVVRAMAVSGWSSIDLQVSDRIQTRARG